MFEALKTSFKAQKSLDARPVALDSDKEGNSEGTVLYKIMKEIQV